MVVCSGIGGDSSWWRFWSLICGDYGYSWFSFPSGDDGKASFLILGKRQFTITCGELSRVRCIAFSRFSHVPRLFLSKRCDPGY